MPIGGENRSGRVSRTDLTRLAAASQLDAKHVIERFGTIAAKTRDSIDSAINTFSYAQHVDELASTLRPRLINLSNDVERMATDEHGHGSFAIDFYSLVNKNARKKSGIALTATTDTLVSKGNIVEQKLGKRGLRMSQQLQSAHSILGNAQNV